MDNIIKNVASLLFPKPIVENFFGSSATNNFDDETRCSSLNVEYPNTAAVSSLDIRKHGPEKITLYENDRKRIRKIPKKIGEYKLRDFYIKSSHNCSAVGAFKKDYVDICAIKNGIKQGCRCLDFEIYSKDNKPVVATSSSKINYVKESNNHIPFFNAMKVVVENAFNAPSPCPFDPMILHFRIKSENKKIYSQMATDLQEIFTDKYLLPKEYGKEYRNKNLGNVEISKLRSKIIIVVDKDNTTYESTSLYKYVNMCSNTMFLRLHRNYDVTYVQDFKELIQHNKGAMSIVLPDLSHENTNVNPTIPLKYGCQFVTMNLQNNDENMQYYTKFFNDYGTSFVLKEKKLRKIDKEIPLPPLQDEKLSYRQREQDDKHYSFRI